MVKLRTGIVGYGKAAHLHTAALRSARESNLVAVCGRRIERARAFADQYGITAYASVSEMIKAGGVQVVVLCTPHPAHRQDCLEAVENGAHALVEKPLASSLADCDLMIEAARSSRVRLGVVSQRRFYAPCQRVKKAILEGRIGRPILGTAELYGWRSESYYASDPWRGKWDAEGGGVLVNQSPHQLDLLLWYMGEIDSLYGCWDNFNHPYIEVEDTAIAVIRFKSGALGNIVVSNSQNPALCGKVHVYGQNGASIGAQTDGGAMFIVGISDIEEPPTNDLWTIPGEEEMLKKWQEEDSSFFHSVNAMEHYHRLQAQDFLRAIIDDHEPLVTAADGRRTVELFTAIYRSQRDAKPIKFPLTSDDNRADFDGRTPGRAG